MGRWQPGAAQRLQQAALELFDRQGFDGTTAAEIAEAAGLTQRTFFRHFRDKRDVLFFGQEEFVRAFRAGIDAAPAGTAPMDLVAASLASAATFFPDERRPYSRLRQAVIDGNPTLQERERHKLAELATAVAATLRDRGIGEPAATLAAESGATVFDVAFAQWIRPDEHRSLAEVAADVLAELRDLGIAR
ncbi:TetR family transcriptional regulator [Nakamurella endophytica]|uniref:TetR family transcriptional regulator n=1 Tax=Nakamurella endophytica TaxID=1748367 RepID=A0A917TEA8_9ACTN|nr:TetR family transcriptional regulator [Nakamurella endophytica]GGM19165.1 TetR family transcriptional regulator [Nakamurella endophytica]